VFEAMRRSFAKGEFFNNHIRGRYTFSTFPRSDDG
jgi:hypothetical protein